MCVKNTGLLDHEHRLAELGELLEKEEAEGRGEGQSNVGATGAAGAAGAGGVLRLVNEGTDYFVYGGDLVRLIIENHNTVVV